MTRLKMHMVAMMKTTVCGGRPKRLACITNEIDEVTCKKCWHALKQWYPVSTRVIEQHRTAELIASLNR